MAPVARGRASPDGMQFRVRSPALPEIPSRSTRGSGRPRGAFCAASPRPRWQELTYRRFSHLPAKIEFLPGKAARCFDNQVDEVHRTLPDLEIAKRANRVHAPCRARAVPPEPEVRMSAVPPARLSLPRSSPEPGASPEAGERPPSRPARDQRSPGACTLKDAAADQTTAAGVRPRAAGSQRIAARGTGAGRGKSELHQDSAPGNTRAGQPDGPVAQKTYRFRRAG